MIDGVKFSLEEIWKKLNSIKQYPGELTEKQFDFVLRAFSELGIDTHYVEDIFVADQNGNRVYVAEFVDGSKQLLEEEPKSHYLWVSTYCG